MSQTFDDALARLDDYIRGDQEQDARAEEPPPAVAAYEEDLFARALAGAAPELAFRSAVSEQLRALAARGTIELWLTARGVERMLASGRRVQRYEIDMENPALPVIGDDVDILIARIPVDLRGVSRLDAEVLNARGERLKLMPQIEFDPEDGAVFTCCEVELARIAAAAGGTVTRLWAHDDSGRRLLREIRVSLPVAQHRP